MDSSNTLLFVAYAIMVSFLWGVAPITHKALLSQFAPVTFHCLFITILMICTLFLIIAYRKQIIKDMKRCDSKTIGYFTLVTLFTSFIPLLIYLNLMKDHPSHIVTAITYSSPFFTLFLAWYFLNEPITPLSAFGVILVIIGIVCLSLSATK